MAGFEAKYNAEQREAIYDARFARGLTYERISKAAADGDLVKGKPFTVPASYVGDLCRAEERRRSGKTLSELAALPARDATEALRRALVNLADSERLALERQKPGDRDLTRLGQLAKVVLDLARIPGPKDERPANPATRDAEGKTRGKLTGEGGVLLAAHRDSTPARPASGASHREAIHGDSDARPEGDSATTPSTDGEHGSRLLDRAAA